jgi:Tfp pilus assembly protein PilX
MKVSIQSVPSPTPGKISPHSRLAHSRLAKSQHGVVLIIALIMLVVISMLAAISIRNATTTISVSGNVRTTELATQAAEIALQHCERSVLQILKVDAGGTDDYATTFIDDNILFEAKPPDWQNTTMWDGTSSKAYLLPLSMVNQAGMAATYKRAPECMVERMIVARIVVEAVPAVPAIPAIPAGPGGTLSAVPAVPAVPTVPAKYKIDPDSLFRITARGFGPEVENGAGRPVGSEVWLQSQIKIRYYKDAE